MRFIDADAYLKKICTYNETGCGSCKFQTKCPADEPTIEAEPMRHGKWRFVNCATGLRCQCSECLHWVDAGTDKNYCPNCGARMDEERKEE